MTAISIDPRIAARREQVEVENSNRRNRKAASFFFVLAALAGAAGLTQTSLLDVDQIAVSGAGDDRIDEVFEIVSDEIGRPLVTLDLEFSRARIAALPWVESVSSSRDWTGRVTFEVVRREPVAQFLTPSGSATVDTEGRILEVLALPVDGMPVIEGATFEPLPGEWLDPTLLGAVGTARGMPEDVSAVVDNVLISKDGLTLDLHRPGMIVLGDDRELEAKYRAVRAFLASVDLSCLDTLDVRAPEVPVLTRKAGCT